MQIVECPRDAMQGIKAWIPTELKIKYLNQLLQVGFHTLDFGSFVSAKAIPQMQDTAEVLANLDLSQTQTKLLAIIANFKGAEIACNYEQISYLGFPLSVSETFQVRNTNKTIAESLVQLAEIQNLCLKTNKILVVYLSMGFGNPYNEPYSPEIVLSLAERLAQEIQVSVISLADTIGVATPESITALCQTLIPQLPQVQFGVHLHSPPKTALSKITAAHKAGCTRFDGALLGFGGCPMAKEELVGNINTQQILQYFAQKQVPININELALHQSLEIAHQIFGQFH